MTDKNIAIRVQGLGKKYVIGGAQEQYHTLRDAIVNSVKAPFVCCEETGHAMKSEFLQVGDINGR